MIITSYDFQGQILLKPWVMYLETTSPMSNPIAIRVSIDPDKKTISWGDTGRGKAIRYQSYKMTDHKVEVLSTDNSQWTFVPLTVEIFNRIKNQLVRGKEFQTDKEVQDYYSNTDFY